MDCKDNCDIDRQDYGKTTPYGTRFIMIWWFYAMIAYLSGAPDWVWGMLFLVWLSVGVVVTVLLVVANVLTLFK